MIELSDRSVRSLLAKVFFLSFQFFSVRILLSWTKRTHASTSKAACIRMIDFSAAPVLLSTYHCVTVRRASPHNWENHAFAKPANALCRPAANGSVDGTQEHVDLYPLLNS